jgi:selenocysteine lyase/cysteine desulfurase
MQASKDLFSLPDGLHYLNHAYMSPLSKRVAAAGAAAIRRLQDPSAVSSGDFFTDPNRIRERFARLIGAPDPQRVAIIPAASYGLAQVARNTALARGQNVVMIGQEFPSNRYVWGRRCGDAGATLREIPAPSEGADRAARWDEALIAAIDRDTAVVTLASVDWTDGTRFDLDSIGARAREVGAALVVDGTQSVGAVPFDLGRVRPDALICAGYKWLTGPYSLGAAWFGERYDGGVPIEEAWTVREGSADFAGLVKDSGRYRPGAVRYDVGEASNFVLAPMLLAALDQVLEWGPEAIEAHGGALGRDLIADLADRGFLVNEESGRGGHLFGLRMPPSADPEALRARLQERRIRVSVRGRAVRIAFHLYNDEADVAALRAALLPPGRA